MLEVVYAEVAVELLAEVRGMCVDYLYEAARHDAVAGDWMGEGFVDEEEMTWGEAQAAGLVKEAAKRIEDREWLRWADDPSAPGSSADRFCVDVVKTPTMEEGSMKGKDSPILRRTWHERQAQIAAYRKRAEEAAWDEFAAVNEVAPARSVNVDPSTRRSTEMRRVGNAIVAPGEGVILGYRVWPRSLDGRLFAQDAPEPMPQVETTLLPAPCKLSDGSVGGDWFVGYVDRDRLVPETPEWEFETETRTSPDGWLAYDVDVDSRAQVSPERRAMDEAVVAWLTRDEPELAREQGRRPDEAQRWLGLFDTTAEVKPEPRRYVEGDRTAPGLAGEREWLDEQLLKIGREFKSRAVDEKTKRLKYDSLESAKRHAKALRTRFNTRRYVEALGGDPDSEVFAAWKREQKVSFATANEMLAAQLERKFYAMEVGTLAVPGLIVEEAKGRAPQFARPKLSSIVRLAA